MKIGALVTVYNHELFIEAYLNMISKYVDKIVILFQKESNPQYVKEHFVDTKKDNTESICRNYINKFNNIEFYETSLTCMNFEDLNNEGARYMKDCDIVLRIDPDCFFTDSDFIKLIDFIKNNNYDQYRLDFSKNSINYYVIGRFDRGTMDAIECREIIAFNPNVGYSYIDTGRSYIINWDGFMMHHFRGWKKSATLHMYNDDRNWITAPQEIINKFNI